MSMGEYVGSGTRRAAMLALALLCVPGVAAAGVTSSTNQRKFVVEGTTALSLVRYMNGHAISGDHGNAYASIHPNYDLSLTTKQTSGGMCRPSRVDVHVTFDLTLPAAASPGAMGGSTRRAWNGFVGFATAHENHHKASYLNCAKVFVAQAMRKSAPSCASLRIDLDQKLREMRRMCEAKQRSFDQSQARTLARLSLFSMARYQSR
jgi:predicted secreted Zn-dependent protease